MFIFQCANLLCVSLLAARLLPCHGSCAFFNSECFLQEFDDTIKATLRFTLICHDTTNSVKFIKVTTKEKHATVPQTLCHVFLKANESCSLSVGCTCDPVSRQYSVSMAVNATESTQWELSSYLNGDQVVQSQTGVFDRTYCTRTGLENSTQHDPLTSSVETDVKEITEEVSTDFQSTAQLVIEAHTTEDAGTGLGSPERLLLLIIGVVSVVAVSVVLILVVFVCHLRKRVDSVSSRLPPAPHRVRRTADNGVMFRVPPGEHLDRDSFVNVLGHDYAEIPDTVHSTLTDSSMTTLDSSPVSDSSMSDDCLHHLACPSSDSSLPEDYLHPVASRGESATSSITRAHVSSTQASVHNAERPGKSGNNGVACKVDRIAAMKADPPYANM